MTNQSPSVHIGDILHLALPLETVLVGANAPRRFVEWSTILTSWNQIDSQIGADDLVIVPRELQATVDNDQLNQYLRTLAEMGVAGLVLFQKTADSTNQLASELNLPLLITPPNYPIREIHRAITSLLHNRQQATIERGMQLYRRLSEMSREGKGLKAMTDVMCKLTGKIIVAQDKRLEIKAISIPGDSQADIEALGQLLMQRDLLPDVLRNRKAAARAPQKHWQQLLPGGNMARLISPIISGDRARGYLSLIGPADQLDMLDTLTVEHGAAACALEMAKAKAVSEAEKALRGNFLEGLLAGTLPQKEIERLEARLDHDTHQPHAIMTFCWATPNAPSLRRLETTINWLLRNHSRPALVHNYSDKHICVFQALKDEADMQSAHQFIRRLQEQITAEYPKASLRGGISGPARTLAEWPQVYSEALQAMELGIRLNMKHVVEFRSLGVYRLLIRLENIPEVRDFVRQVIGPLVAYDQEHRSNLVETIDAYFDNHGNISKTAESLYIHRNTLLYRLERIQELTGHDLDQANMRLALQLALKLWQLHPSNTRSN
ncbi:MAG: hypothetical protein D6706_08910 [Chloroflexi bacterium]|nr:MAG: hypothetical protein D6706_08910 [Chloroflexota bacterium]